jgi:hypothetical protein
VAPVKIIHCSLQEYMIEIGEFIRAQIKKQPNNQSGRYGEKKP